MDIRKRAMTKKPAEEEEELSELAKKSASLKKMRMMREKMEKELQEQQQRAATSENTTIPLSLASEYKAKQDAKDAKGKMRSPADSKESKHRERISTVLRDKKAPKDVEVLLSQQEKERRDLEFENQRLRDIINLRQDCSIRREEACQKEIHELKSRLDSTVMSGYEGIHIMPALHNTNNQIQTEIQQLKGRIENNAELEKMNIIRAFRVKMHELKKQLAEEKHVNYTGAQEWIEKNKILQHELDVATNDMHQLREKNKQLIQENKELKVSFQTQERQRTNMIHNITVIKKENQRLEDQIEKLEYQCIQLAKKRPLNERPEATVGGRPYFPAAAGRSATPTQAVGDRERKYLEAISKVKKTLAHDKKQLRNARSQHVALLAERTELEIFLRQCIDDVRKEISRNSKLLRAPTGQATAAMSDQDNALDYYTASDRKRILEILMSKERVLTLLYDRAFPIKADTRMFEADKDVPLDASGNLVTKAETYDIATLLAKWKWLCDT
eukprot:TRINITY_DN65928_c0_g1_i1.p1 TRINITY_DN65928_c0_g1~~TRINITY_DN65928_c0_g1_i1.p1  ORF type:complete len:501 (+),score=55.93 TRINITY_DN65928_c0_g1_i1:134-1636(+)